MSAKKKRHDALKAKEKKQKVIAAVGGVILVALLAFQVPRVMNRSKGAPPPAPQTVATPTGTTPTLEAPTTMQSDSSTGAAAESTTSSSSLITSSSGAATHGQLSSFSRFESKDPFSQQVSSSGDSTGSRSGSASASAAGTSSGGAAASRGSGSSGPAGASGASAGSRSTASGSLPAPGSVPAPSSVPAPDTAVISVNGTLMSVTVGSDFPQPTTSDPSATALFHLVSLTKTTAKISIAGGSYTSGASTTTLHVNKAVTLMNTADGSRFKLILKPQGTPVPGGGGGTTSTPTVTLPAPTP